MTSPAFPNFGKNFINVGKPYMPTIQYKNPTFGPAKVAYSPGQGLSVTFSSNPGAKGTAAAKIDYKNRTITVGVRASSPFPMSTMMLKELKVDIPRSKGLPQGKWTVNVVDQDGKNIGRHTLIAPTVCFPFHRG
jgi:hypothetical protein